jgi:hypothetical protein
MVVHLRDGHICLGHRNVGNLCDNCAGGFEQGAFKGLLVAIRRPLVYEVDGVLLEALRLRIILLQRQKARNGFLRATAMFYRGVMLTGLIVFR